MAADVVHKHIAARSFDRLLAADELSAAIAENATFSGWHEGIIDFPPTYKYIKGTSRYVGELELPSNTTKPSSGAASVIASRAAEESGRSTPIGSVDTAGARDDSLRTFPLTDADDALSAAAAASPRMAMRTPSPPLPQQPQPQAAVPDTAAAKLRERGRLRTPAWTDRILFRAAREDKLINLLYDSGLLTLSDHKPVVAAFLLNADVVDAEAVQAAIDAAQRALDVSANNAQPRCTVSGNVQDAGILRYGQVYTCTCSVHNSGEV
jgi:hypothetical protein